MEDTNINITFRTRHDKDKPKVAKLHLQISTPGWERRVDYSCMIARRRATPSDKLHLLQAFMNNYSIPDSDVKNKCQQLLETLSKNIVG